MQRNRKILENIKGILENLKEMAELGADRFCFSNPYLSFLATSSPVYNKKEIA